MGNANSRRRFLSRNGFLIALAAVALGAYFFVFRVTTRGGGAVAGGAAVEFSLPDQLGRTSTLAALVEHGPAVLFFYRGYW